MAEKKCECSCGCDESATTTDGGVPVCEECDDYTVDADGQVHCSREHGGTTCPYCDGPIDWACIETYGSGGSNDQRGTCSCGSWHREDRGGWTVPEYTPVGKTTEVEAWEMAETKRVRMLEAEMETAEATKAERLAEMEAEEARLAAEVADEG